jgi:hypothetical protein
VAGAGHTEPVDTEAFIRDGYVAIRGAVEPDLVAACQSMIWDALGEQGVHRDDPASWPTMVQVSCPEGPPFAAAGTSPVLQAAYDELIGAGRWTPRAGVGGAVVARFPSEERADNCGYHIEGSLRDPAPGGRYLASVNSKDRGLLAIFLFSDVGPDDAPTRLIRGSHLYVPEHLAPFGENGVSTERTLWRPSVLCRPADHATGQAGDVFLCHPFIVHSAIWPHRGTTPRIIAQPGIHVGGGFALDGTDPSPVAKAIVRGLELAAT